MFSFDVFHADHEEVKQGMVDLHHRRVVVTSDLPHEEAMATACCIVIAIHGGMVTRILPRL